MQVRHAFAAVTIAAFALTLSACSGGKAPDLQSTASGSPAPAAGEIRNITDGFSLSGTSTSLRTGFPSFADKSDEEIEVILNAGCDGIDATGTPNGGADAIAKQGIAPADAAWGTLAAIQLYCPEYKQYLGGSVTSPTP